eukprot:361150_1
MVFLQLQLQSLILHIFEIFLSIIRPKYIREQLFCVAGTFGGCRGQDYPFHIHSQTKFWKNSATNKRQLEVTYFKGKSKKMHTYFITYDDYIKIYEFYYNATVDFHGGTGNWFWQIRKKK